MKVRGNKFEETLQSLVFTSDASTTAVALAQVQAQVQVSKFFLVFKLVPAFALCHVKTRLHISTQTFTMGVAASSQQKHFFQIGKRKVLVYTCTT